MLNRGGKVTKVVISERNPYEIYLLVGLTVTGLPVALGKAPSPGSVSAMTDPMFARAWSIILIAGAVIALIGGSWPAPKDKTKMSVTGVSLEQVGLVMAGSCSLIFAGAIAANGAPGFAMGCGVVLSFASASLVRAWQLQRLLNRAAQQEAGAVPSSTGGDTDGAG